MAATANDAEWSGAARVHLASLDAGRSATDTARVLHVSRATAHPRHRRYRAEGGG